MREIISLFSLVSPLDRDTVWERWLRFCLEQEQRWGFTCTHLSCETQTLHPEGIRTRSRYLKKIEASIAQGEDISHIGFYLLPKDFRQAVFDYRVYLGLSLGKQNLCEIDLEKDFLENFSCEGFFRPLSDFLAFGTTEVNLLPYNQVFNYNMNCILPPVARKPEECGLIRRLYQQF